MRRIITTAFLLLLIGTLSVQAQKSDQQERRKVIKERIEKETDNKDKCVEARKLCWQSWI